MKLKIKLLLLGVVLFFAGLGDYLTTSYCLTQAGFVEVNCFYVPFLAQVVCGVCCGLFMVSRRWGVPQVVQGVLVGWLVGFAWTGAINNLVQLWRASLYA